MKAFPLIVFVGIAILMSIINRNRAARTGSPTTPGIPGLFRTPPAPPHPSAPPPPSAPPTAMPESVRARRIREAVEQRRTELRRRAESRAASEAAVRAAGPRSEIPGGIDPRLLDRDRTPPPTPDPIHPR